MKQKITQATDTVKELLSYYLIIILTSGLIFHWVEHKKIIDSIWWAFVTAMTVGYGDIYPISIIGRIDAIILMHIVPMILVPLIIIRMMNNVIEDKNEFTHEEQEQIKKDLTLIKKDLIYNNMKKTLITLALVLSIATFPSMSLAKGSFGGGSHASFSSGSHSSGSFSSGSHTSSGTFGGGMSSGGVKSSGSFTHTSAPTSFGGGFTTPAKTSGTFTNSSSISAPKVSTPAEIKAASDAKITSSNAKITQDNTRIINHTTYIQSHPYGFYYNPFSSNWFLWWWMFGTHHGVQQTKVIIDCSKPENTTAPDCKGITPTTPATTTSQTTTGK